MKVYDEELLDGEMEYRSKTSFVLETREGISSLFLISEIMVSGKVEGVEITPFKIRHRKEMPCLAAVQILAKDPTLKFGIDD